MGLSCGALPIGIEQGHVTGGDHPHDTAVQLGPHADEPGQRLADTIDAGHRPVSRGDEAGLRVIQGECRLELAGVDVLLELAGPILGRLGCHVRSLPLVAGVQGHGGPDESLQGLLVQLVALAEIDRTPRVAFEAGVEEA